MYGPKLTIQTPLHRPSALFRSELGFPSGEYRDGYTNLEKYTYKTTPIHILLFIVLKGKPPILKQKGNPGLYKRNIQ